MYDTLILSGGGIKGIIYIGLIKQLEEKDIIKNIKYIYATSIGSLFGLCINIGIESKQLSNLLLNIDFKKLIDIKINNLINNDFNGLDDMNNLSTLIEVLFEYKNINPDITFIDLYKKTNIHFGCIATEFYTFKETFFDYKLTPNISVKQAILASSCIPIFFSRQKINNNYFIDGGFCNNFPIEYANNSNKILGIYLVNNENNNINSDVNINNIVEFILHLFKNIHKKYSIYQQNKIITYKNISKIITLDLNNKTQTLNFNLDVKTKLDLLSIGYSLNIF